MVNQQGLDYIRTQMGQGADPAAIRQSMVSAGWKPADVDEMLQNVQSSQSTEASSSSNIQQIPAENNSVKPKFLFPLLAVLIILALLAGVYFLYFSPQRVFARAASKVWTINAVTYQSSLKAEIKQSGFATEPLTMLWNRILPNEELKKMVAGISTTQYSTAEVPAANKSATISFNAEGQIDALDAKNPKYSIKLDASSNFDGIDEEVAGEIRFLDKNLYLKPDKLPDIASDFIDLSSILGRWIVVTEEDIGSETGVDLEEDALTKEQIEKIRQSYLKNSFIKVDNSLKIEKVNNNQTFRYNYSIDKAKLKSFITEANKNINDPLSEIELKYFLESIDDMPNLSGQIWIGLFDSMPYKISMNFTTTQDTFAYIDGTFNIELNFKDFNKPATIETPTNTLTFTEVGKMLDDQMEEAYNKDTDKDGVTDSYEKTWKTNIYKPDTDGDGYNDKEEICNGYNPLDGGKQNDDQKYLPLPYSCFEKAIPPR